MELEIGSFYRNGFDYCHVLAMIESIEEGKYWMVEWCSVEKNRIYLLPVYDTDTNKHMMKITKEEWDNVVSVPEMNRQMNVTLAAALGLDPDTITKLIVLNDTTDYRTLITTETLSQLNDLYVSNGISKDAYERGIALIKRGAFIDVIDDKLAKIVTLNRLTNDGMTAAEVIKDRATSIVLMATSSKIVVH